MGSPEQRITRTVEMARAAVTKPELSAIYLRRFHRAYDVLESDAEREEVYHRCRREGWYPFAAEALLAQDREQQHG